MQVLFRDVSMQCTLYILGRNQTFYKTLKNNKATGTDNVPAEVDLSAKFFYLSFTKSGTMSYVQKTGKWSYNHFAKKKRGLTQYGNQITEESGSFHYLAEA